MNKSSWRTKNEEEKIDLINGMNPEWIELSIIQDG